MPMIWDNLVTLKDYFILAMERSGNEVQEPSMARFNHSGWVNRVWTSDTYRRAHLDVVDARDTKKLWMMHFCIFPHLDDPSPIFGFDIIAGEKKITGFFHDWSPSADPRDGMLDIFGFMANRLDWKKERELPDWAKQIFSKNIIAAGNINDENEVAQILEISKVSLDTYLSYIGGDLRDENVNASIAQQIYCSNQKKNPHTAKVMTSLGLDEDEVRIFIDECLFPTINNQS